MKKILSVLIAVLIVFSTLTTVFAAQGTYQEENANAAVFVRCDKCEACTGKFGCNCCADCPGYMGDDGVPTNTNRFTGCRFGYYLDVDVYEIGADGKIVKEADGVTDKLIHDGDDTIHYYWKALCCEDCTGLKGCQCNNTDNKEACGCVYCAYTPDHTDEQIKDGLEKGREGYTNGIQSALSALREIMYDLFNKLFEFLRIDVILGKDRVPTT